jgi:hypothetical protein
MELVFWFKVGFYTRIMGSLHEDQQTILITSRSVLLRMRNVSFQTTNKNTRFMSNNVFRKSSCLWNNVDKYCTARQATDDNIIMRIACWISKDINRHSQYVICIDFPPQTWLYERASMLSYPYIAYLVLSTNNFNTRNIQSTLQSGNEFQSKCYILLCLLCVPPIQPLFI